MEQRKMSRESKINPFDMPEEDRRIGFKPRTCPDCGKSFSWFAQQKRKDKKFKVCPYSINCPK